jgi:outer membrane protein OmpA-like peptidoglycan-associated protein
MRVLAVLVGAGLLAAAAALSLRTLRTPPPSPDTWPRTPASLWRPGGTAYTAPSQVLFDIDSATLRPEAAPALRAIAARLRKESPGAVIGVEGHTDDTGPPDRNDQLSYDRAARVASWLVDDAGIPRSRIRVYAFGAQHPAVPNDTPEHRQANRRFVIAVQR